MVSDKWLGVFRHISHMLHARSATSTGACLQEGRSRRLSLWQNEWGQTNISESVLGHRLTREALQHRAKGTSLVGEAKIRGAVVSIFEVIFLGILSRVKLRWTI